MAAFPRSSAGTPRGPACASALAWRRAYPGRSAEPACGWRLIAGSNFRTGLKVRTCLPLCYGCRIREGLLTPGRIEASAGPIGHGGGHLSRQKGKAARPKKRVSLQFPHGDCRYKFDRFRHLLSLSPKSLLSTPHPQLDPCTGHACPMSIDHRSLSASTFHVTV